MNDVAKIVTAIRPKGKISRLLSKLCNEISADNKNLLLHSEVRWLLCGKVLRRVFCEERSFMNFSNLEVM